MICKNCGVNEGVKYGKYTTGEFCCYRCSKAFSTKDKRKDINAKLSIQAKKRYVSITNKRKCVSCGDITINKKSKYCKDCQSLVRWKKFFLKLNIQHSNLKTANNEALLLLSKEYFTNKKSLLQIRDEYHIMFNSVYFFFKKHNINLRNLSESHKSSYKEGRNPSVVCTRHKHGQHITWFGETIYYRSSYEERLMKILDLKQELYYYEKLRFQYVINDEHKTYIADFYLPERNLIIEVKGEWFQKKDKEQIEAKRKSVLRGGYYYMMVGNKEIKELENMGA